jgi:AcrR family transcriptional regulator
VVREVRRSGYDGLTVRNVARRAGVAPATAYTYFASKDHLITEVFWRRLQGLDPPDLDDGDAVEARVRTVVADLALLVADEPELAAACTMAMVATDPEVMHLRERIGAQVRRRFSAALGSDRDPAVLQALELAFSGAMLQAGTGHLAYVELPDQLAQVARLVTR